MGLFDGYFDPEQFQDSGGLLGRLLSLQQHQGQYQSGEGFDPQASTNAGQPSVVPMPLPALPADGSATYPQTLDDGQTQKIPIGKCQMPQFGGLDVAAPAAQQPPDFGDRLSAGLQSWAHTPVGNPIAALANGIAGLSSGQRTDAAGLAARQTPAPAQPPDFGDRLSAGFQSWAHTPVGNPFAALANGIAGLNSGQRSDPAGIGQQNPPQQIDPSGNPQDLNARYHALRPVLGDHSAMLAIVHPEVGKTLIAQALASQAKPGNTANAAPAGNQADPGSEARPTGSGQPPGLSKVGHLETPTNPNQAFGELQGIQERNQKDAVSGTSYVSGVRDGNVTYNSDGSLDVTNGTVVTFSYTDGHAKTVTVTNTDIAHIDAKTGEVVLQKSL